MPLSKFQGGILGVGFNPLQAPNAPTIGTASGGDASASVAFTAPTNVGGSAITSYAVQSTPGGVGASGASSPITVSGLTNGISYTFRVAALNSYGPSPASGPSGAVIPAIPFDENRIIIPMPVDTYQVRVIAFNWSSGVTTNFTTLNTFYTNGGNNCCSVAVDPSKNVYIEGGGGTSNTSFTNFAYVGASSSSASAYRYYSGLFPDFGDYYAQMCYNPQTGGMLANVFNHPAESSPGPSYLLNISSGSVSLGSTSVIRGWDQSSFDLMRSIAENGSVTNSATIFAQGSTLAGASNNFSALATSPYTAFSTIGSSLASGSGNCVAPLSATEAVVVVNRGLYRITTSGVATNISSIGGISSGSFESVSPLANGAFVACNTSPWSTVFAYSNASTSPTWQVNLSSLISGGKILYMIGNGKNLYLVWKASTTGYVTKVVFNLATGSYTSETKTISGSFSSGDVRPNVYRYY